MAYESNSIFWIEVEKIVPNPYQPRREFDAAKLRELSESIRMYGVLQPLVVTRKEIVAEGGAVSTVYELIAGERRLRASKLAGLTQVPVIIRSGEETELMKLELAIIENLQREDLNPVDRALAFRQLADHFGLSHQQVAEKVGRSREYVSNSIRLLGLPETILGALRVNDISDGHARTLLMLNERPEEQDIVFREILLKKLSVREVERIARKIATEKVRKKEWKDTDPELMEIERKFTETLGTRVQILKTDYGGRLTIDYFSQDDLQKLLDMVNDGKVHVGPSNSIPAEPASQLEAIASATPVEPIAPLISEAKLAASGPEPLFEGNTDEDMFTRHDTLEATETVPEETSFQAESATPPAPLEAVDPDLARWSNPAVSAAQQEVPPAPGIAPRPEDATPTPEKQEDPEDPDIYSVKNFTL